MGQLMETRAQLVTILYGKPLDLHFARGLLERRGINSIIFDETAYYCTHRVDARLMVSIDVYQKAKAELSLAHWNPS